MNNKTTAKTKEKPSKKYPRCPLFEMSPFELIEWYSFFVQTIRKRPHGYIVTAPNMTIRTNRAFVPLSVTYHNEALRFSIMSDNSVKIIHLNKI